MSHSQGLMLELLDYVVEQAKEIDVLAYDLAKPRGSVWWPSDFAALPGVHFDIVDGDDVVWLRIERLEAKSPPKPSPHLTPFVVYSSEPGGLPPELKKGDVERYLKVEQGNPNALAELYQGFDAYTHAWKIWSETERPRRSTITLYASFFSLKHQIEVDETSRPSELVWGVGVASWLMRLQDEKHAFYYPMLSHSMEIHISPSSMTLDIKPRSVASRIELDALIACEQKGAAEVETSMRDQLAASKEVVSPFQRGSFEALLRLPASNLDADGVFIEVLSTRERCPPPGPSLVVSDGWVLFSRPRSNNYLLEDLKALRKAVVKNPELPMGPLAFVSEPSDTVITHDEIRFRGLSGTSGGRSESIEELYFPLPYNKEQVSIIERLERSPGVAVQGPPGTGKTHTIANVICHYLAKGRRVLVTSRGEAALEVLQEKIPESVRALTVALLSGDREGVRQFQASIATIQHRVSQLNPQATEDEIGHLHHAIENAHRARALIDRRIDEIAVGQLGEIEVDGVVLRAQAVAELVVRDEGEHAWLDDVLSLAPENAPPLSEEEMAELRSARRRLGNDLGYLGKRWPSPDGMPTASQVSQLHRTLVKLEDLHQKSSAAPEFELRSADQGAAAARSFLEKVLASQVMASEVESVAPQWGAQLRARCRQASFEAERKALESVFDDLDRLIAARVDFLQRPVEFPALGLTQAKVVEAVRRGAQGGKTFGVFSIGAGDEKQVLANVRVAGIPPADAGTWGHVLRYIQLHQSVLSFETRWNAFAADLGVPRVEGGVATLRITEMVATAARKVHRLATTFDKILIHEGSKVFARTPESLLSGSSADLAAVAQGLERHVMRAELTTAAVDATELNNKLSGTSGPICSQLRRFMAEMLGNPLATDTEVGVSYGDLYVELRRVADLTPDLQCVEVAAVRLRKAGALGWADRIVATPAPAAGDDSVVPAGWRRAWTWARLKGYLSTIEATSELRDIAAKRAELGRSLERNYREVAAQSAWLQTKKNASGRVLQALASYATAIRRIGQGTGSNAMRYRRDARDAMADAAGAVPCWIMSHARISEAMPAELGAFDLVIVDEASQSDLWALPAILRGKKILVVGDDKQVSPDGGFISAQRIDGLRTRFLARQPYAASMTPEKSLYDLAARVFAAHQVMLREHFRSVQPIIGYSNKMFYGGDIQPLRSPKPSERLDPPLVDIFVAEGYRNKKKASNLPEAEAIAAEIEAILADPKFDGRSIGVVSMLGGLEQAKLVDRIVRDRCSAAQLMARRFECGEPRNFQGSERDIIFLTMVADKDSHVALSGNSAEQRFNVATSRARDRMYLVRSVTLAELSDKDLRQSLLQHFDNPTETEDAGAELESLCESGFEREVFTRLIEAGYRVIPQVHVGSYRIDLVVEGADDRRLAIELDGDDYHGPDRWKHDMARQQILERAGWVFWRCFASSWALDRAGVLDELVLVLERMKIQPLGALAKRPLLVEHRVWPPVTLEPVGVESNPPLTSSNNSAAV